MEFFDTVFARYCHKGSLDPDQAIPRDDLARIAGAGLAAPSAMNRQSPELVIVDDREVIARIGEITDHATLASAPALVVVISNPGVGEGFYREDYAATTENILLAATALGYGVGWIDGIFRDAAVRQPVSELLGIPADRLLSVVVPVGKPADAGERRPKKPFGARASWNRYDIQR
jgi:nitroreductase